MSKSFLNRLLFAVLLFLFVSRADAVVQAAPGQDSASLEGMIVGRIEIGEGVELAEPAQVILMSPAWNELWNAAVQQSLDLYSSRYREVFARNREAYREVAGWAYREALDSVILRMRESMGEEFSDWVREIHTDGRFEFEGIPFGEYRIIALAVTSTTVMIWSETVSLSSSVPQYVQVHNRVP